ncbi:hypothetical protein DFH09DRAFT_1104967 [Mycena vulgaris]|nr:hypothetical protein DFH09DRAFT_1104967 [Mycena vulgaris]
MAAGLNLCIPDIEQLLQLKPGDVRLTLRGLHSVIYVPSLLWYETELWPHNLRVHHASFLDFLNDPARSTTSHVGNVHRHRLASDILKAFSYTHDDPTANYLGLFLGKSINRLSLDWLEVNRTVQLILMTFIRVLIESSAVAEEFNSPLGRLPFILLCDSAWGRLTTENNWFKEPEWELTNHQIFSQLFSQTPVQLMRILDAYMLYNIGGTCLFQIGLFLDYSWDELRTAIPNSTLLRELHTDAILWELAARCIRRMMNFSTLSWSQILRSCGSCPDLLQNLREIELPSTTTEIMDDHRIPEHLHNVMQWLKKFPQPPLGLLARIEQYFEAEIRKHRFRPTFHDLEGHWTDWKYRTSGGDIVLFP